MVSWMQMSLVWTNQVPDICSMLGDSTKMLVDQLEHAAM
jgi:hypothetical protein